MVSCACLHLYLSAGGPAQGPLWQHTDRSPLTPLFTIRTAITRSLAHLGMEPKAFGLHSLHIGAASTTAALGFSVETIQSFEHWCSSAFRCYIP